MNPNTVFSASVFTSLVLWYPSMRACLRGDLDLAPAGLRYVAALVVSRLALGGLARLVDAYRAAAHGRVPADGSPVPATPPTDGDPGSRQRRRDDQPADSDADPGMLAA